MNKIFEHCNGDLSTTLCNMSDAECNVIVNIVGQYSLEGKLTYVGDDFILIHEKDKSSGVDRDHLIPTNKITSLIAV